MRLEGKWNVCYIIWVLGSQPDQRFGTELPRSHPSRCYSCRKSPTVLLIQYLLHWKVFLLTTSFCHWIQSECQLPNDGDRRLCTTWPAIILFSHLEYGFVLTLENQSMLQWKFIFLKANKCSLIDCGSQVLWSIGRVTIKYSVMSSAFRVFINVWVRLVIKWFWF